MSLIMCYRKRSREPPLSVVPFTPHTGAPVLPTFIDTGVAISSGPPTLFHKSSRILGLAVAPSPVTDALASHGSPVSSPTSPPLARRGAEYPRTPAQDAARLQAVRASEDSDDTMTPVEFARPAALPASLLARAVAVGSAEREDAFDAHVGRGNRESIGTQPPSYEAVQRQTMATDGYVSP